MSSTVAELHITDRGDNLGEKRSAVGVFRLFKYWMNKEGRLDKGSGLTIFTTKTNALGLDANLPNPNRKEVYVL